MLANYSQVDGAEDSTVEVLPSPVKMAKEPSVIIPKKEYKAAKGDAVDEKVASIINSSDVQMPLYRIADGKYLIGTESKICIIKGSTCVVRVGGGFETMEVYL